jgi:hypothetical protein
MSIVIYIFVLYMSAVAKATKMKTVGQINIGRILNVFFEKWLMVN